MIWGKNFFFFVRLALTNLAKHHAISYALIRELGDAKLFFQRFPNLECEAFCIESNRDMLGPSFDNGIDTNIMILEVRH